MYPELKFLSSREWGDVMWSGIASTEAFLLQHIAPLRVMSDRTPLYFGLLALFDAYCQYDDLPKALEVLSELALIPMSPGNDCSSMIVPKLWRLRAPVDVMSGWVARGIGAVAGESHDGSRRWALYYLYSVQLAIEAENGGDDQTIHDILAQLVLVRRRIPRFAASLMDALVRLKEKPEVMAQSLPVIESMIYGLRVYGNGADSNADIARHMTTLKELRRVARAAKRLVAGPRCAAIGAK